MDENGYRQQDAEECWSHLVDTFAKTLISQTSESTVMKELFGLDLIRSVVSVGNNSGLGNFLNSVALPQGLGVKCAETNEENTETESVYSLQCRMSQDVQHLDDGIKFTMKTDLEKHSPLLGRNALYHKKTKIDNLPRYLVVNFPRVDWNKDLGLHEKIAQRVEFPPVLDMSKHCSDNLKQQMSVDETDKDITLKPNGAYDLMCVLTHSGNAAVGHYVAWVKQDDGSWILYDDGLQSEHEESDVLKLCGGGGSDEHMACICLYKDRTT